MCVVPGLATAGHLITCNPAAVNMFGKTIWLQSDIFGMGEGERAGLNSKERSTHNGVRKPLPPFRPPEHSHSQELALVRQVERTEQES